MCIQDKDSIIVKGEKYILYSMPLDSYWTKRRPKPKIRLLSTSCWRGYVATWEIFNANLYLVNIKFNAIDGDFGLGYLFYNNTGKVKADFIAEGELNDKHLFVILKKL